MRKLNQKVEKLLKHTLKVSVISYNKISSKYQQSWQEYILWALFCTNELGFILKTAGIFLHMYVVLTCRPLLRLPQLTHWNHPRVSRLQNRNLTE